MSEDLFGKIKTSRSVLQHHDDRDYQPNKEGDLMLSKMVEKADRERKQAICLEYLKLAGRDLEKAKLQRTVYVKRAKELGIKNDDVAAALGLTEARVRQLQRAA